MTTKTTTAAANNTTPKTWEETFAAVRDHVAANAARTDAAVARTLALVNANGNTVSIDSLRRGYHNFH